MGTDPAAQLLQQIGELMQQYMQLGPDTPLAPVFSQVLPQIEQGMQGMGPGEVPGGGMPPEAGGMPPGAGMPPGGQGAPPPEQGGQPPMDALAALTGNANMDFGNATKQAAADHKATGSYGKKKKGKGK